MSESSEDVKSKNDLNFSIKLKQSLDSSNNSQNEDYLFFSLNNLILDSNFGTKTTPNKINKKGKVFESMDIDFKKKLFSSEMVHKLENKQSYEAISTEPTSIKVKNYKSPHKRFSVFKLIEKDKRNKKK